MNNKNNEKLKKLKLKKAKEIKKFGLWKNCWLLYFMSKCWHEGAIKKLKIKNEKIAKNKKTKQVIEKMKKFLEFWFEVFDQKLMMMMIA